MTAFPSVEPFLKRQRSFAWQQAVYWIKKREGKQLEGRVKTFNDSDFLKHLEMAIQYGFPFLFENLDEYIDPVIDPVLEKSFSVQVSRHFFVAIGKPNSHTPRRLMSGHRVQ